METRILGGDLEVSAVGLGCMGMSHAYGAPADREDMRNLIAEAVDLGVRFFDTAELYGNKDEPNANGRAVRHSRLFCESSCRIAACRR